MAGFEKAVKKHLLDGGFKPERSPRGSHVIWSKDGFGVSVPAKIRSRHTANEILKLAGIGKKLS